MEERPSEFCAFVYYRIKDVVRNTIIPMDIGFAVDGDTLVIRQLFAPKLATEAADFPIIPVEPPPKHGTPVFIDILLRCHRIIVAFNIHDADGIVDFAADGHTVASNHIHHFFGSRTMDAVSVSPKQALGMQIYLIAAVILAKAPVIEECIAIKECIAFAHAVSIWVSAR